VFQAEVADGSTCQLAPLRAGPATSHLHYSGQAENNPSSEQVLMLFLPF